MDLNRFVNSLKFRLAKMMDMVKEEENNLRESALFCSKCNKTYNRLFLKLPALPLILSC